ncbi:MAG: hypothetical protein ACM3VS_06115 [Candidatus Dadabacteria bacterium]
MEASSIYILVPVVVIALLNLLVFLNRPKKQKASSISILAFGLLLTGIFFGDHHVLGYSLIAMGVVLSVIDMAKKPKERQSTREAKL